MVRVKVIEEIRTADPQESGEWELAFQWCRYVDQDDGSSYHGYRFIWYRPDGTLQSARGQARLPSIRLIRELTERAESEGWGAYDTDQVDAPDRAKQANAARHTVKTLAACGVLQWNGAKPAGLKGVRVKRHAVSETVIEGRR